MASQVAANSGSLPFLAEPHDALRQGLTTLKDGAVAAHPAELIQTSGRSHAEAARTQMLQNVYGSALPTRMMVDKHILSGVERLPGLPTSGVLLESYTGGLDDFSFDSYLNLPAESEAPQPDLHSRMEAKLGLATKPAARGML